ncbi:flagellar basal body-associated FliL family protein [Geomonas paludis]|uniref:Flagellar protein FliL n=2 Tax=Geomonas TaxID=2651583 RepID=A0A6V8N022_9BACT|nr:MULTISPECIES: flagellar basal body-associated FliL family protein [Geomonas]QWV93094.1 flagellar basal body-associated FliL family protein [Geomonas oryzisoli]UPU36402.1 flagellar basal body-associated FliL family protein [Geomonas paludis]GFO65772.1 flagellar basal body protein FliL [Geomonas paludis]
MAEPAKPQETPEKNNKKLFIIIGAVVAVLAIGGAAAFFMGGSKKEKAPEGAKVEAKAEGGGEHGAPAKGGEGAAAGGGTVYPLEPFIVNIYDGQELRYLKLKVEFEMANPQAKAELDAKLAPLRDAILILLTTKTMQEIQDLQGKNQLREQILAAVSKVVPPSKVTKVYFTDFVVQ